jgi:hypothetical protein
MELKWVGLKVGSGGGAIGTNMLGEPWKNSSSAELMSVEGDTFGHNLNPAPLVS